NEGAFAKRSFRGWRRAPYALAVGMAFLLALFVAPAAHIRLPWASMATWLGRDAAFAPAARLSERYASPAPAHTWSPVDSTAVGAGAKVDSGAARERASEGAPASHSD